MPICRRCCRSGNSLPAFTSSSGTKSATALLAASNMLSVMVVAADSLVPMPTPGKMNMLLHCEAYTVRPS